MDKSSVVIVTGASAGLGKATAAQLAKTGAQVVMLCRNPERGRTAQAELEAAAGGNITLMQCDLASLASIEAFCSAFRQRYDRLDVLVNNAGALCPRRKETSDGFELHFGVNYLGHFLLTNRLLDLLTASGGRVIVVTSVAHRWSRIFFDDLQLKKRFAFWRGYSQSKLANVLFTYELARRLNGTGAVANCLHPGIVATGIALHSQTGIIGLLNRIQRRMFLSPEQGAQTAVYLACSPDTAGISGKYFVRKAPVRSSRRSYDMDTAKRLWDISEKMCRLR